jgi:hypothetical protein
MCPNIRCDRVNFFLVGTKYPLKKGKVTGSTWEPFDHSFGHIEAPVSSPFPLPVDRTAGVREQVRVRGWQDVTDLYRSRGNFVILHITLVYVHNSRCANTMGRREYTHCRQPCLFGSVSLSLFFLLATCQILPSLPSHKTSSSMLYVSQAIASSTGESDISASYKQDDWLFLW